MSITAVVNIYVSLRGDINQEFTYSTGDLEDSPGMSQLLVLTAGDNVIDVPAITDITIHGFVIVPPDGNLEELILKGDAADVGLQLSAMQASIIQFGATPPAEIVLESSDDVDGFRLIWF